MTQLTEEQFFQAVQSFDQDEAKELFQHFLSKIDEIFDNENGTLLHVAANYNNHEIVQFALERYDEMGLKYPEVFSFERKKKWLNRKDNEGFNCIHYAVFRGNSNLAFLLEEHGADIYAINRQGLTVLHIAAQGDSPVLMYYYLNKGMKISTEDAKGSTALHWACYSGQENAAYALIAWGAELDKQDFTYGMTPLHLAVMSGNGRIVKKLLVRGCDRNIQNYSNRLALDIALQNQYKNITEMIIDKRGLQEFFNIKTPYRSIGKFTFPIYFLIVLFLTNYILNISFVLFTHFPQDSELAFVYLLIGLLVVALFLVASNKEPGYIRIDQHHSDFGMLKKFHPSKICFECMLVKPQRSRHCEICRQCVSVYDHHCPWVANCVGSKNYFWFYLFLMSMEVFMIFTIVYQGLSTNQTKIDISKIDWTDHEPIEIIRIVCVFYALACSLTFILPLTYLVFVQSTNCMTNQTTFERYGYQGNTKTNTIRTNTQKTEVSDRQMKSLKEHLLVQRASHVNSSIEGKSETRIQSGRLHAETQTDLFGNCFNMCFRNAKNISYQVGKCS